jgi:hypothetical protein
MLAETFLISDRQTHGSRGSTGKWSWKRNDTTYTTVKKLSSCIICLKIFEDMSHSEQEFLQKRCVQQYLRHDHSGSILTSKIESSNLVLT